MATGKQRVSEQRLKWRAEARAARLSPEKPSSRRLLEALRSIGESGRVYYVVLHTPEQLEDIYAILIDDNRVVTFELERGNPNPPPVEVEVVSIETFRRGFRGTYRKQFELTLEAAKEDLQVVDD